MRLYLLGRTLIEGPEGIVDPTVHAGRQGTVALTYLADAGHRVERHELGRALWSEEPPGAWDTALSALLSKLRRAFTAAGVDGRSILPAAQGYCELRLPPNSWVDTLAAVEALDTGEALLAREDGDGACPPLAVATTILGRPLLPGETGSWVEQRRRELGALNLRALEAMASAWLLAGNPGAAAAVAARAATLAPLRESARVVLMQALIVAGDRAGAIGEYRELQRALREELGIDPGPAAEGVYREALEGGG